MVGVCELVHGLFLLAVLMCVVWGGRHWICLAHDPGGGGRGERKLLVLVCNWFEKKERKKGESGKGRL